MSEDNPDRKKLRQRAEAHLDPEFENIEELTPDELKHRIHDLKVYQIELEMQNEALRQAQLELANAKDRYFDLYHKAPVGHVTLNENGVVVEVNAALALMLGIDPPDIKNHHFFQFISDPCRGNYLNWLEKLGDKGAKQEIEVWMNPADRSELRVQLFGCVAKRVNIEGENSGTTLTVMVTIVDITENWRSQQEKESVSNYLNQAMQVADMAWWHMNPVDGTVHFHQKKTDLLGYKFADFYGKKYTVFTDLIHPDDYENTMQAMRDHLEGRTETYKAEYRIRTASGGYRWFFDFGKFSEHTPEEASPGLTGIAIDVTDRKQTELDLQESENKYRLLAENTKDLVCLHKANGTYMYISPSIKSMLGYEPHELLGRYPYDYFHSDDSARIAEESHQASIEEKSVTNISYRFRKKDGSYCWLETYTIPVLDNAGEVAQLVTSSRDVTDRIESEAALRESEARYALAQDVSGIGSWEWNLKTNELFWSDEIYSLFGVDKTDFEPTFEGYLKLLHPEDKPAVLKEINAALETGGDYEVEHRIFLPNNLMRWIFGRGGVVKDNKGNDERLVGIVQDITSRKAAEQQMRMLSYVVEHSPSIIIVTDANGIIEYVNSKFTAVTGYTSEEAIGRNPRILKSGSGSPDYYRQMWETITTGREWQGEIQNKTKDGRYYWAQISIASIADVTGKITHYIGVQEDISERKKMELDLLRAKEEAEKANQAKSTFLASMSHELRTPLNSILGFSQVLNANRGKNLTEKELKYVNHIKTSGALLLELINDVLDLSKIESGHFDMELTVVKVSSAVAEVIDQVSSTAAKFQVNVTREHSAEELYVRADERGIRQVLLNLLSNAIKYNRRGGDVTVSGVVKDDRFVQIAVTDTGPGIPEKKLKEMFQPFNRLGAEATSIEGTGIGLTITERLMAMMGGTIDVDSTVGSGSTFSIQLPRAAQPNLTEGEGLKITAPSPVDEPVSVPAPKKVLYIEDNKLNLKLIESILGPFENLELSTAPDGRTGIQMARESKPDLILMDINLPGMDGFEAFQILQQTAETSGIPAIAVTARAMEGDEEKALEAGFVGYVSKPIDVAEFKRKVLEALL